jgi:hypothetical protein
MTEPTNNFPRRGVFNRLLQEVEDELASLPMVLVTPILSGVLATALAVSLPASRVHDGVVDGPPVLVSLGLAVLGAVSGLVLVGTVLAVGSGVATCVTVIPDSGLVRTIRMATSFHLG